MNRKPLQSFPRACSLAIFLMGVCSSLAQVMLVRELIVVFSGNELSIGIILSSWLIWGTVGTLIASRTFPKSMNLHAGMVSLQLLLGIALSLSLYATRSLKVWAGLPIGHVVTLTTIVAFSLLLLLPVSLLGGMLFAFASEIWASFRLDSRLHALPYSLESVGAAVGGLVSLPAVQYLHSFRVSMLVGILCAISSLIVASHAGGLSRQSAVWEKVLTLSFLSKGRLQRLNIGLLLALIVTSGFADVMQAESAATQWLGYDLQFYQNSIYGNVAVTRREEQFTIFVDGVPAHSLPTPDLATIEEITHLPLLFHPSPQKVLLLGGGIGGSLKEIMRHGIVSVDYVELDPLILQAAIMFVEPSAVGLADSRAKISNADARFFVAYAASKYDVVLVNLPSPSTILVNRMYTREFFATVSKLMNRGGIMSVSMLGSSSYLSQEQAFLNACIMATLRTVFKHVRPIPGDVNLFLASDFLNLDEIGLETLATRLNERRIETALLSEYHVEYKLDPRRYKWFLQSISQAADAKINADLLPSAVFYNLWIWNSQFSEFGARVYESIKDLSHSALVLLLLIVLLALVVASRRRRGRQIGFFWMVLSTGFCGMMSSVVLAIVFQSIFGYVYQVVGLLVATFMFGLFIGSLAMMRIQKSPTTDRRLVLIDMAVLGGSLFLPSAIALIYSSGLPMPSLTNGLVIFLMSLMSGITVGAEFSAANRHILETGEFKPRFGGGLTLLYSSDLAGAWAGALVVSLFLPVLGVLGILLVVATLKAISVVTLLARRRS